MAGSRPSPSLRPCQAQPCQPPPLVRPQAAADSVSASAVRRLRAAPVSCSLYREPPSQPASTEPGLTSVLSCPLRAAQPPLLRQGAISPLPEPRPRPAAGLQLCSHLCVPPPRTCDARRFAPPLSSHPYATTALAGATAELDRDAASVVAAGDDKSAGGGNEDEAAGAEALREVTGAARSSTTASSSSSTAASRRVHGRRELVVGTMGSGSPVRSKCLTNVKPNLMAVKFCC
nr:formin-like protein 6 [Aegilops tauschii subsp. strangulata]